ncbi:hypothetical protein PybrP1_002960 [[Pythium] brassicae (nom. inval.)]|nr:hypothetical protein PybrP1_002960 [[Pythium] brassicae (nom. inval.)]
MSKREYFLQKALNLQQQLSEPSTGSASSGGSSKAARETAKYRELCPPGTEDSQIRILLEQHKGDARRMENAISELWEDYRGGGQDDWATVEKKGKKQPPPPPSSSSRSSQPLSSSASDANAGALERLSGRGSRGAGRARGASSSRGGRGGGRGRGGRGGVPRGERAAEQDGESPDESGDSKNEAGEPALEATPESEGIVAKKPSVKQPPAKPAPTAVAPPPVGPILTGAWTKKPNLTGLAPKPKAPAAPVVAPPAPKPKPVEAPAAVVKSPSPKKAAEQKSPQKTRPSEPVASEPAPKIVSPKKVETKTESTPAPAPAPAPSLASGWGSLDVSTAGIGEWPSSTTDAAAATTPSAWARGSPLLTATAVSTVVESVSGLPTVVPGSPKDIQVPRSESRSVVSSSTSPKQYLKMGKWESAATTNLSLQFGSFSLGGVEHVESTSPRGWSSTTTTTTTATTSGDKTVSKTETQSAWSKVASPKEKAPLSPARKPEIDASARKGVTTSAPPGLSVDSGRVTPKSSPSPRTFAPSAPSPASLPKPDDVKRSTPSRGQGPFQTQPGSQSQGSSKIGSGYSAEFGAKSGGLYQASYNQYSMDLGTRATGSSTAGSIAQTQGYHPHYAPPPPPGMALPYNPYNYASYYQGYGYYQNPQYAQYSPRTQYPPRGSIPYGVEGPMPGFSTPGSGPVGYQDQHLLAHQHEYGGAIPQGFGEISGAYLQQPPIQGHHHHGHQQGGPQNHGKGSAPISGSQQAHSQRGNAGMQGYQSAAGGAGGRDHTSSPPVPNVSAGMSAASYGAQQHYGWASYGGQPIGGWGHMVPQGYQQSPSQHQQHPGSHQQSYRQYGNSSSGAQSGSAGSEANSGSGAGHAHAWSS